jgi:hypothetical protein
VDEGWATLLQLSVADSLDQLRLTLNQLTQRDQEVLKVRYGLESGVGMTQKEMGKLLGFTTARAGHLELRAMRRLRRKVYAIKLAAGQKNIRVWYRGRVRRREEGPPPTGAVP